MPCPRCGADKLMPAPGGREVCLRCGTSVLVASAEPAVSAAVLDRPRRSPVAPLVLLTIVVLLAGAYLVFRMSWNSLAAYHRRQACAAQLHKIAVALKNYADDNSVYPPAITFDPQGKPMHSWRALILPHFGKAEEELFKEYHFDEPWDGPHNLELAKRMPGVYRCPEDPGAGDSYTSYLAIVDTTTGDFAAYPTGGSNAPPKKPPMTAYLVVESADSGVNWLEPTDLTLDKNGQPDKPLPAHFGYHVGGSLVVDEDGETAILTDAELAKAIVSKPTPSASAPSQ